MHKKFRLKTIEELPNGGLPSEERFSTTCAVFQMPIVKADRETSILGNQLLVSMSYQ